MNLMSKPVVALTSAVLIVASLLSPALAASNTRSQHMRTTTVQQQLPADAYNQYGNGSVSNDRLNMAPNYGQGYRCVTDDGYGRLGTCDYSGN